MLKEDLPIEYYMGKLLNRKKRGRPKIVPSALRTVDVCHEYHSDDDVDYDVNAICPVFVYLTLNN